MILYFEAIFCCRQKPLDFPLIEFEDFSKPTQLTYTNDYPFRDNILIQKRILRFRLKWFWGFLWDLWTDFDKLFSYFEANLCCRQKPLDFPLIEFEDFSKPTELTDSNDYPFGDNFMIQKKSSDFG